MQTNGGNIRETCGMSHFKFYIIALYTKNTYVIYIISLHLYRRCVKSKAAALKKKREQTGVGYTNIKDLDDIATNTFKCF